ncbi:hypothetical protein ABRP84_08075 [Corynebacterium sp. KPL2861]|uniref:hypothetical protein n=1 Tax=Corynebacterium sp. KPL2861 TaxID=3158319 RepID=UPI0032EBD632
MNVDLATIQMHLDNFVNTQEGWYKVLSGVTEILSFGNLENAAETATEAALPDAITELSS